MTKRQWVVVAIGAVVAVVGIGLGFSPVTLQSGVPCGNAWSTSYVPYFAEQCSDARSAKGVIAVVITIAGLVIAAVGPLTAYLSSKHSAAV